MRLHRLTVTAFGPFAGTQVVDFDALASGGLFLLRGATGAGKSSVLDAVCYALYGAVPGLRPRTRLRSDHAGAGVRTEVRLELTLGGRRLEVTRSPEQPRAKKRGSGDTVDKARTLLREWTGGDADGGWRAASTSHQEVGAEIQQLLGMSREQFCQVVLLPQGEFARFLHAGAPDRAELLGRLFDTARFGAVEDWLTERRQRTEKDCQAVLGEVGASLERLRQAAGRAADAVDPLPPVTTPAAATDGAALGWAAQLRAQAREELTVAHCRQQAVEQRRELAEQRAREVEVLADRQARHRRAVRRSGELAQQDGQQREALDRLERAQRAEAVLPLLRLRYRAAQAQQRCEQQERFHRAALPAAHAGADAEELTAAERHWREQLGGLRTLLSAERRFLAIERDRAGLERERDDDEAVRAEAEAWLTDEWPGQRQRAGAGLEQARAAAGRADRLDEQVAEARRRADAAEQAGTLRAGLAQAGERGLRQREDAEAAREGWLDLRERRLDGMAAELAERLADGAPCPVCGSAEHPAPAPAGPGRVTREQEQRAEQRYREAARAAEQTGEELRRLERDAAALAAVAGEGTPGELREAVQRLEAEQQRDRRTAAEGLRAQEELDRLEREHERRTAVSGQAAELVAARTARLEALATEQRELAAELARGRAGAASVAARVAELEPLADGLAAAAAAVREAAAGAETLARAEREALAAAEREGFTDAEQAGRAALPDPETARLRAGVQQYRDDLAQANAELTDPQLTAAAALAAADPAADRAVLAAAEAELRSAYAAVQAAGARCAELDRLSAGLAAELRRLAPLAADHRTVSDLAFLAAGTGTANALRMSLETYVLAARLEQVAEAAGARLKVMSQGRYSLAHNDARSRGAGRSGLGLSVLDAWTGQSRDTSTLSGGESFFASLALALGLADVVTDEAGGMPLDTLFIDEGFGSLDEDTLEDVLDELDRLRARDRAVGIVSHVADLRGRIPTQLEVRKGRGGSTLHQHGAG
ncbi:AAA family ATPase [Streptacidiphilus cavernicola]|uniref:Nuclease SbcCD subunit C n=1 Tax=Streptacidiphilus cavernicola TaxID=3342716 RepID=A0ABV6W2R8_9ACTN